FGVVAADISGDGLVDLYVANDMYPNFVFLNKGNGTFADATESSGAALDGQGRAHSGMGVDAEDVDGDGRPDLIVTGFDTESNPCYRTRGKGLFPDRTAQFGLAADTTPYVGWGCALADFDNDGWPDLFATNGQVDDNRHVAGRAIAYAEPADL